MTPRFPAQFPSGQKTFRFCVIASMFFVAISNFSLSDSAAQESKKKDKDREQSKTFDLEFASDEGGILIAIRPHRIFKHAKLAKVAKMFEATVNFKKSFGVSVSNIDQFIMSTDMNANPFSAMYMKTIKPVDYEVYARGVIRRSVKKAKLKNADVLETTRYGRQDKLYFWQPDDKRIVGGSSEAIEGHIEGKIPKRVLLDIKEWDQAKSSDAAMLMDEKYFREMQKGFEQISRFAPYVAPLEKLFEHAETGVASATRVGDKVNMQIAIRCDTAKNARDSAKGVTESLDKSKVFVKALSAFPLSEGPFKKAQESAIKVGIETLENAKVTRSGRLIKVTTNCSLKEIEIGAIDAALAGARIDAMRVQAANNGKQMALAFHNYTDAHKGFPPAVIIGPKGHKHSWRVELLPYMGEQALYEKYKFDEAWDSKNNLEVMKQMPAAYRSPNDDPDSTNASYFAIVGPGTLFPTDRKEQMGFRDVRDGTSNTLMYVEAKRDIPWTKPEDIVFDPKKDLPTFGGFFDGGFNAAFADGSVRFLSNDIKPEAIRKLLLASDGEIVTQEELNPPKKK